MQDADGPRQAVLIGCAAIGGLFWTWYNVARFGRPFAVGYSPRLDFSGYAAFLFAPGGSILIFAPIAVAWAIGLFGSDTVSPARRVLLAGPFVCVLSVLRRVWRIGPAVDPMGLAISFRRCCSCRPAPRCSGQRDGWRRAALAVAIAGAALLQLPGVLVDYSKVSVDWARGASKADVEERNWRIASSPLVLGARAARQAVPANVAFLSGRQPLPRVETTSSADNRDFAQQLSFSLDFWWLYLFYLHAIPARAALAIALLLTSVTAACGVLAWMQTATPTRVRRWSADDLLRDRLQLQVRRALVDLADLGVAEQLLDRIFLDEPVAAEEIHRQRRDALGDLRREDLADRRFGQERLAGVAQARGVVDGQPRGFDVDRRARELMLDGLELGDRLAELLALLGVRMA